MTQQSKILIPLAIIGLFFFSIGFALGINSYLMPVLKDSFRFPERQPRCFWQPRSYLFSFSEYQPLYVSRP